MTTAHLGANTLAYQALSYTWGDESPSQNLICCEVEDGKVLDDKPYRRLLITPNCKAALRRMRDWKEHRIFWVDAICINQADIEERNSQVEMMAEIYRRSARVVVWLGSGSQATASAMRYMGRLGSWYGLPKHLPKIPFVVNARAAIMVRAPRVRELFYKDTLPMLHKVWMTGSYSRQLISSYFKFLYMG